MKAVVYHEYGSVDVLAVADVPQPVPVDGQVLVRVHASSVNSWDWDLVRGRPFYARLGSPRTPEHPILGADIAGTVEAVGPGIVDFVVGDEVFGDVSECGWGGFGEYVAVPSSVLARKSPSMSFEEAAATPQAGLLALQGLRYKRPIEPGSSVLINGAGGGVGTFAVQMAKLWGAEVTAVDSAPKLGMLRVLGADSVIDYQATDFTATNDRYDRILDVVGQRSLAAYRRSLRPKGVLGLIGGTTPTLLQVGIGGPLLMRQSKTTAGVVAHRPNRTDLNTMTSLYEAGNIEPVIDTVYPLDRVPDAVQHLGDGHAQGKVVISVA